MLNLSKTNDDSKLDSTGKPAPFQPGDRIVALQAPWHGLTGSIIKQRLHYDGCETFWGDCVTRMDDDRLHNWNCWQLDREDGWRERLSAREMAKAAKVEEDERAHLARLKAKYEEKTKDNSHSPQIST